MKKNNSKVNGENILYHILQKQIIEKCDVDNPTNEVKFMIEQLLLYGGVWFKPVTYQKIPVLKPFVIRDASCRNKKPGSPKDSWGEANAEGLLRDDNSLIKNIPTSLKIESRISEMNGKTLGNGFVASHIWINLKNKPEKHACQWERTNSFIPNLVWLPKQLSKLTDRNGSYAQKFIQHVSYLLYRKCSTSLPKQTLDSIWGELEDPGITPVCKFKLSDLNYFEDNPKWLTNRRNQLNKVIDSILGVLSKGVKPNIKPRAYCSTLPKAVSKMSSADKKALTDWLIDNLTAISSSTSTSASGVAPVTVPRVSVSPSLRTTTFKKSATPCKPVAKTTASSLSVSILGGKYASKYSKKQIADCIKAYLIDGYSLGKIEVTYLGEPERTSGRGWAAKHLFDELGITDMKGYYKGTSISDVASAATGTLKSLLDELTTYL